MDTLFPLVSPAAHKSQRGARREGGRGRQPAGGTRWIGGGSQFITSPKICTTKVVEMEERKILIIS